MYMAGVQPARQQPDTPAPPTGLDPAEAPRLPGGPRGVPGGGGVRHAGHTAAAAKAAAGQGAAPSTGQTRMEGSDGAASAAVTARVCHVGAGSHGRTPRHPHRGQEIALPSSRGVEAGAFSGIRGCRGCRRRAQCDTRVPYRAARTCPATRGCSRGVAVSRCAQLPARRRTSLRLRRTPHRRTSRRIRPAPACGRVGACGRMSAACPDAPRGPAHLVRLVAARHNQCVSCGLTPSVTGAPCTLCV